SDHNRNTDIALQHAADQLQFRAVERSPARGARQTPASRMLRPLVRTSWRPTWLEPMDDRIRDWPRARKRAAWTLAPSRARVWRHRIGQDKRFAATYRRVRRAASARYCRL